jgi:uncharacterized protein (TIGR02058 family)
MLMMNPGLGKLSLCKSFHRSLFHAISSSSVSIISLRQSYDCHHQSTSISVGSKRSFAKWSRHNSTTEERPAWSEEWKRLKLGAKLHDGSPFPSNLFFVQLGFGVDQHGDRTDASKAAIRAVRNAIEFNSIPGVIEHIPGGRNEMLIHVKLGIPSNASVDVLQVAKVFPCKFYIKILLSSTKLEEQKKCVCACSKIIIIPIFQFRWQTSSH